MKTEHLASLTRHIVKIKGGYRVSHALISNHLRNRRSAVEHTVYGFRMLLDPHDYVDQELLFHPQLYEPVEIEYVRTHLHRGDTFVDIGSHAGVYSLVASRAVGEGGRVVAVDADPRTFERLGENLRLNNVSNASAYNLGVSDRQGSFPFYHWSGAIPNSGANTLIPTSAVGGRWVAAGDIPCVTLTELLSLAKVDHISGMKLDIERAEYKVLSRFFADAPDSNWPSFILFEEYESAIELVGGSVVRLLESTGHYRPVACAQELMKRDHIFERGSGR